MVKRFLRLFSYVQELERDAAEFRSNFPNNNQTLQNWISQTLDKNALDKNALDKNAPFYNEDGSTTFGSPRG